MIIAATNDAYPSLILYGLEVVEQRQGAGKITGKVAEISVNSFDERRFVIAAIRKFVGIPCTDGREWKDL